MRVLFKTEMPEESWKGDYLQQPLGGGRQTAVKNRKHKEEKERESKANDKNNNRNRNKSKSNEFKQLRHPQPKVTRMIISYNLCISEGGVWGDVMWEYIFIGYLYPTSHFIVIIGFGSNLQCNWLCRPGLDASEPVKRLPGPRNTASWETLDGLVCVL